MPKAATGFIIFFYSLTKTWNKHSFRKGAEQTMVSSVRGVYYKLPKPGEITPVEKVVFVSGIREWG